MYELINKGLCRKVGLPDYGKQDRGVSPGGAMDLFSFETGNLMLGNPAAEPALEMMIAPEIRFLEECRVVLIGGTYDGVRLYIDGREQPVNHAEVFKVPSGSILRFGNRQVGFRTYLCCRKAESGAYNLIGRSRGPWDEIASWRDPDNCLRVMEGPEHRYLDHPDFFVKAPWKVSNDLSNMGMRLECLRDMPSVSLENMISGPVSDGTVQLTPKGPIILLRYRQTVGGYPRIFNVISADLDQLGQLMPGHIIRFRQVSLDEAGMTAARKAVALDNIRERFAEG
jgi:allophanate hydrolase subunit 2